MFVCVTFEWVTWTPTSTIKLLILSYCMHYIKHSEHPYPLFSVQNVQYMDKLSWWYTDPINVCMWMINDCLKSSQTRICCHTHVLHYLKNQETGTALAYLSIQSNCYFIPFTKLIRTTKDHVHPFYFNFYYYFAMLWIYDLP